MPGFMDGWDAQEDHSHNIQLTDARTDNEQAAADTARTKLNWAMIDRPAALASAEHIRATGYAPTVDFSAPVVAPPVTAPPVPPPATYNGARLTAFGTAAQGAPR